MEISMPTWTADMDSDGGSALTAMLKFVNMDSVPVMIVMTVLIPTLWIISVTLNHYLNPAGTILIAAGLLLGSFVLAVIITKIATIPLARFFKHLKNLDAESKIPIVGRTGFVKSGEVSTDFGQLEIPTGDSPILVNARIREGNARLKRGDECIVTEECDEKKGIYYVKSLRN